MLWGNVWPGWWAFPQLYSTLPSGSISVMILKEMGDLTYSLLSTKTATYSRQSENPTFHMWFWKIFLVNFFHLHLVRNEVDVCQGYLRWKDAYVSAGSSGLSREVACGALEACWIGNVPRLASSLYFFLLLLFHPQLIRSWLDSLPEICNYHLAEFYTP